MRAILAADLPDNAKAVALTIALHLRVKTGACNPSYPTLARACVRAHPPGPIPRRRRRPRMAFG
jgi:hypothetical protein